jgi:hypothetical protein
MHQLQDTHPLCNEKSNLIRGVASLEEDNLVVFHYITLLMICTFSV